MLVISRSPMKIFPEFHSSNHAHISRVVDFPHPDGPTRTMNSPSAISRLIPGTAGLSAPGYQRCASSKVTVAIVTCSLHRQVRAGRSVVKWWCGGLLRSLPHLSPRDERAGRELWPRHRAWVGPEALGPVP